jgi:hypothetical protein
MKLFVSIQRFYRTPQDQRLTIRNLTVPSTFSIALKKKAIALQKNGI